MSISKGVEMEFVNCLNCDSAQHDTVVETPDFTTGIGEEYRLVRCRECGLSFTNPRPGMSEIGAFYPADYKPHQQRNGSENSEQGPSLKTRIKQSVLQKDYGYPQQEGVSPSLAALAKLFYRRNRQRQNWIPFRAPGRLLDFGCGAGRFLKEMSDLGWNVQGMDVSADVARDVAALLDVPVHAGTLPHAAIQPESFDAVTMWNSLEHVHDPRAVVRAAYEALRPGGILVVGLPNIASWSFRTFQHAWYALDLPRHLVHFSPDTLCDLLRREHFEIQSVDHIGRSGWIRNSAQRLALTSESRSWKRAFRVSRLANSAARRSERKGEADSMRIIAEKPIAKA